MNQEQLAVAQAAHTARRGELAKSLQALDGLDSVEALDLRARVLAQLGRWQEADDTWAALQDVEPERALARRVLAGRSRQRPIARPLAAVAVAVLAVGGIATGTAAAVSRPDPVVAEPSVAPQTITVTTTAPPATVTPTPDDTQLDAIAAAVATPGVTVLREPGAVRVVFDRGLFTAGTTFAPGATDVLDRLAPKLKGIPGITVVGQSVVVPGSAAGGSGTALARAQAAAQHLARAGGLPLTRLALASGDQAHPLFPGAVRNRTVSLLLTA
ncbi:hypothetical protein E1263_04945 [Kribbella antibiotica]|uniref:OmpA-like domain-containing protein n=1 Tax=Kribbella antibiotica TaxID=190195 RepID=A0A4R4ZYE9_9ACTN|nr:hypothetical protein [Kribbella antibiotica]TDD62222.1 hypothetical protein E1263_04945 [Kribbella antibiotica]